MNNCINIGVIGGGSWGTALAILLSNNGHSVNMWVRDSLQLRGMKESRENKKYLPGITLPSNLKITNDISEAVHNKQLILLSVPSHGVRDVLNNIKTIIKKDQIIVNVAKG